MIQQRLNVELLKKYRWVGLLLVYVLLYYFVIKPVFEYQEPPEYRAKKRDEDRQRIRTYHFDGVVLSKGIKSSSRGAGRYIILQLKDGDSNSVFLGEYDSNLFEHLQPGDSISTKAGDTLIYRYTTDGMYLEYNKLPQ